MKLRYFLRGLASGIVITTLLLTISHNVKKDNISEQEIIERAEKLGMVMEETDLLSVTVTPKGEPTAEVTEAIEPTEEAQITSEVTKGAEMESTQAPTQGVTPTQEPTPMQEPTQENASSEKKVLTIVSGMWSDKVASELQAMGLVENASEFDQYLIRNGYADKLVVGTFEIPAGASYDEIARIITGK